MRGVFIKIFARYAREWLYIVIQALEVYKFPSICVKMPENGKKRPFWGVFRKFPGRGYPKSKKMGGACPLHFAKPHMKHLSLIHI